MGEQYVTPPVVSFDSIYDQSTPYSPIVFVLSPGADPAGDLSKLAERMGYGGNRFKFLAMGQGQEKVCILNRLYIDVCMCACMRVCAYMRACVYTYIYICIVYLNSTSLL